MGKSKRFIYNSDKSIPGPNKYMLPGFVDELMKKTGSKFNISTNINSTKNNFFNKTKASSMFSKEEMEVNISNMS